MHALLHCRKPGRHNSLRLTSGTRTGETRETRFKRRPDPPTATPHAGSTLPAEIFKLALRVAHQLSDRFQIRLERRTSGVGHTHACQWLAIDEALIDRDVLGFFELAGAPRDFPA